MTVQAWLVFTPAQVSDAETLNDENQQVLPVLINNSLANNLGYGVLVGQSVAPARILNDPDYSRWVPSLSGLPIYVMDSDTLFIPIVMPD